MPSKKFSRTLVLALLCLLGQTAELILRPNLPTCSVLIASFDPIKVEAQFPAIASKVEGEHFVMTLTNFKTQSIADSRELQDNQLFRQNFYLEENTLYDLCFEFVTHRHLGEDEVVFVKFAAEEHFESKINQVTIPAELVGEENLQSLYDVGLRMGEFVHNTGEKQKKEREVEDELVGLSSHKTKRIITITLLECAIIIASGVYQIIALRKFLIQKSLY